MNVRPRARAIVALAAAYAVVLQAMLLAVGGSIAGSAGVAAASLCSSLNGANPHSTPAGHGRGCPAACLACCCGAPATPAAMSAIAYRRAPTYGIAVRITVAASSLALSVARAHRSRAPPLG